MRRPPSSLAAALGVACALASACTPFQPDDPRVGTFGGAFIEGPFSAPRYVQLRVLPTGQVFIQTGVDSGPAVGSDPAQLGGGGRDVRFSMTSNGLYEDVHYEVNGSLSGDDQIIQGTLSYWVQKHGLSRGVGVEKLAFKARRRLEDAAYRQTVAGDFGCTAGEFFYVTGGVFKGNPAKRPPAPSCFSGQLNAIRLGPEATANYGMRVSYGGVGHSWALFSACDGQELVCHRAEPGDAGTPPLPVDFTQRLSEFEDVVLVAEGDPVHIHWIGLDR